MCVRWYLEADRLVDVQNSELFEEALVLTPEQPDVWDAVQDHGQPLQAETERPAQLVLGPRCKNTADKLLTYNKLYNKHHCK